MELGERDVNIQVSSPSQNGEETATETKAGEEQNNIEVADDSSDDDHEIDVLQGHKEKSAKIPVSPTSDTENDIPRLNESDDNTSDDDNESDDELNDLEYDEDIDYTVLPAASSPKLLVI